MPGKRIDELGVAQREFAGMQRDLRAALLQKTRLVALGTAVSKINHDLRNILATAQLVSDHLNGSADPNVRRIAPTLLGAIDRAVALCSRTLGFVQEDTTPLELSVFPLRVLVTEVGEAVLPGRGTAVLDNRVADGFTVYADRDQLFRVLHNLARNAVEAGADCVTVRADAGAGMARIDVEDDGPGLPPRVREHLFRPFTGAGRSGGTGLGLSIARDLMRGHGGDIELVRSAATGTSFRLTLPAERAERGAPSLAAHG
jgi:signal transduction histidine kinase